ncbi:uncharacterized protein LOC116342581 isoform X2 [Contarinia nasturtii]|uniref:uncharacterized protein LOC116342581 isoform X2 n=1 Tax=Contarinia nasturtii TaxID=265458 RepID=UPI0012D3B040|nr:uncharacterized protein LOC116342581 isoform X2 [Contarinia nasturtii]
MSGTNSDSSMTSPVTFQTPTVPKRSRYTSPEDAFESFLMAVGNLLEAVNVYRAKNYGNLDVKKLEEVRGIIAVQIEVLQEVSNICVIAQQTDGNIHNAANADAIINCNLQKFHSRANSSSHGQNKMSATNSDSSNTPGTSVTPSRGRRTKNTSPKFASDHLAKAVGFLFKMVNRYKCSLFSEVDTDMLKKIKSAIDLQVAELQIISAMCVINEKSSDESSSNSAVYRSHLTTN